MNWRIGAAFTYSVASISVAIVMFSVHQMSLLGAAAMIVGGLSMAAAKLLAR